MAKINEIISKIETLAPLETQEEWDNSGWQINLDIKECNKILIALNATEKVIKQAIDGGCDLIITHHPMIFAPIKFIEDKIVVEAIQNNIQIYSAHTNFDKASTGTTFQLAKKLGFENTELINDYTRVVKLNAPLKIEALIQNIKSSLNIKNIKISNQGKKTEISSIAFCAGSGGSFAEEVTSKKIDAFITSDIKYHDALNAQNLVLIDIGHFESEIISLEAIKELLQDTGAEVVLSSEEPIFEIV